MSVVIVPGSLAQIRNTDIFPFPFIVLFFFAEDEQHLFSQFFRNFLAIPQHQVTIHEIIVSVRVAGVIREPVVMERPFYAGAIIGNGDRKSAPFLVLGLSS